MAAVMEPPPYLNNFLRHCVAKHLLELNGVAVPSFSSFMLSAVIGFSHFGHPIKDCSFLSTDIKFP